MTDDSAAQDRTGEIPRDRSYTSEHEWVLASGNGVVRVGVTDFAQNALGDVVYVSLPPLGTTVTSGEPMAEIESTKSVADVYAPVSGTVVARNGALKDSPELVNLDPYGEGWIVGIQTAADDDPSSLLDADGYTALVAESS